MKPTALIIMLAALAALCLPSCKSLPVPVSVAWTHEVGGKEVVAGYHSTEGAFLRGRPLPARLRALDGK